MKRYANLFPNITAFDNLYLAFRKAAKGKRRKSEVAAFEFDLETNLFTLQEELQQQTYQHGAYRSFVIHDPKRRVISAAPFRDRVVHHALCNIIEPIFDCTFIGDSYANRIGKGNHKALARAQQFSRTYPYVLQCDLRQYFPSIDHILLLEIIKRKIEDTSVIWLCQQILKSGEGVLTQEYQMQFFAGDDLLSVLRPRGLPIGNLTSQFWGNVYLNELDQTIKRNLQCTAYLRYVDDFLLFAHQKNQLWEWRHAIIQNLNRLRLTLHEKSSTVYPSSNGIPFLGFVVFPTHCRLKQTNGIAFQRRFKNAFKAYRSGQMSFAEMDCRIKGWVAHASHGDTWRLRTSIFSRASG
jgi:RNA-directed DNA polymerase